MPIAIYGDETLYTQSMKAIGALWVDFRDQNIEFSVGCHSRALFASQAPHRCQQPGAGKNHQIWGARVAESL